MGEYTKRIPTELEINILQCVADDDGVDRPRDDRPRWLALFNCALVCKAWAEHAREHLYYAINMNILKGARQFHSLRQYPHLRRFVRDLKWPRTEVAKSLYRFDASDADVVKDVAPAVTKLRFRRVDHRSLEPPLREAISAFANVKELDMTGSIFEDWSTVMHLISKFPSLTTLAMPRTVTFQQDSPEMMSFPPPSRLIHIKLGSGCEMETISWIRKGSTIHNIQTVEAESQIDSNVLAKLLRSLSECLQHLVIYIDPGLGGNISDASPSCYRLTENTALQSIKVVVTWNRELQEKYKSVITNLIGSIRSPHLRSVTIMLMMLGEVEHFPWEVVNNLAKISPHMLQRVEIGLRLVYSDIGTLPLDEHENRCRRVRSALPELDEKVVIFVASKADISDAVSYSDPAPPEWHDYDDDADYGDYGEFDSESLYDDDYGEFDSESLYDDDGAYGHEDYLVDS